MPLPAVEVLLSTYQGADYLGAQLASLRAQQGVELRVRARDDGSTDATREILADAARTGLLTQEDDGAHLGAAQSFLRLLQRAGTTDFTAFSDQDDVWLPDKLARAVAALAGIGGPALYCSRARLVDEALRPLGLTPLPTRLGFGNALVENVAIGCTMVLNREAVALLGRPVPGPLPVHDWWCHLVVSALGTVVFDDAAPLQYRQHGRNAFGAPRGPTARLARAWRRFGGAGAGWPALLARHLLAQHGDALPGPRRVLAEQVARSDGALAARARVAASRDIWRQRALDDLAMRGLILAGRY